MRLGGCCSHMAMIPPVLKSLLCFSLLAQSNYNLLKLASTIADLKGARRFNLAFGEGVAPSIA